MEKESLREDPTRTVHVMVSMAAMFQRLEDLEAVAHDSRKVKVWAGELWLDLTKCKVALF